MLDLAEVWTSVRLTLALAAITTVNLLIGKQPRFRTSAGRVGRKLAVRVLDPLSAEPLSSALEDL